MEKAKLFDREQLRYSRAEVESAWIQTASSSTSSERSSRRTPSGPTNFAGPTIRITKTRMISTSIKEREEARRKKGRPPRAVLLPDWDKDDEQGYYDDNDAKKRATNKRRESARKRNPKSGDAASTAQTGASPTRRRKTDL